MSQDTSTLNSVRATTLAGKSMREFLSQIQATSNSLALVGSLIMLQEHVDSILEGLLSDYHPIIVIIESNFEPQPIEQVGVLLLAHEARLNKFKQSFSESPSINPTQSPLVPNKQDPESFSNFRGGSSHGGGFNGGFNYGGGRR